MKWRSSGQTLVIITLILPALLGAVALGTDATIFYFNWVQLQKAADSAALAGANFLPDNPSQATATANQFAENNGIQASEIVSTTVATDDLSISIKLQRTVPYFLAKVLGLTSGVVATAATAAPQFPPTTVNATSPDQVPPGETITEGTGTPVRTSANAGSSRSDSMPIPLIPTALR